MRRALASAVVVTACLTAPATATPVTDEPLICVIIGEIGVLDVFSYDPPDPCIL